DRGQGGTCHPPKQMTSDEKRRRPVMKYMMFIKHPDGYEAGGAPPALYAAMGEFIEDAASKGIFIDGAGLQPMEKGARVKLAGGRIEVIDGPFCETKEVVGGYAICDLPT